MMRRNNFNMVMNNALNYLYIKGLKYLDEVYVSLKNGKGRIDGFIKVKQSLKEKLPVSQSNRRYCQKLY